ncbi:hypothetical protein K439DRAFT_1648290 [Ramaria rubella]|nr:hypothetical protein K439DRAFT_1648290 [Ramaria rubella]
MVEILEGLKSRYCELSIHFPEMAVVDNCCHVHAPCVATFPEIKVVLDVYHFLMRYLGVIVQGMHNPHRSAVAKDITDAILKTRAGKEKKAEYYTQNEQELRLQAAYDKWATQGVWLTSASKVHADQMAHVKKGCLAQTHQDISSDGSHIEGSHKGWNSLQHSFAGGLEMILALAHDYVLHRNIRIATNSTTPSPFVYSTFGSHHVRLVSQVAQLWNMLLSKEKQDIQASLSSLPELHDICSGEHFGLVRSENALTFSGLFKEENEEVLIEFSSEETMIVPPAATTSNTPSKACISLQTKLPSPLLDGVTRSEQKIALATGILPTALTISTGDEFFLFMELRAENQWVSYGMTAQKWATATAEYNYHWKCKCEEKGNVFVSKKPRALVEKLGEMERKLAERIQKNDYKSMGRGDESFWRKHCAVVPLVKCKPQTCTRYHRLMYPGPTGSPENHKKEFCSDGGSVKFRDAPWPQPPGIFIKGTSFDILAFLRTILPVPVTMEDEAFVSLLSKRSVIEEDGTGLFELFDKLKVIGDEMLVVETRGEAATEG